MSFLTLEDINTTLYNNQRFWWHEIDCSKLPDGEFTDLKVDFCRISKHQGSYHVYVDNDSWAGGALEEANGRYYDIVCDDNCFMTEILPEKLYLYMGPTRLPSDRIQMLGMLLDTVFSLNMKELSLPHEVRYTLGDEERSVLTNLDVGYNHITDIISGPTYSFGYLLVKLLKTDFQFNCNQELINGKVNTVKLGVDADYKPNGDLIGDYTPEISVFYGDETLPVTWNPTINDYTFDIDLSNREKETDVILTVFVENNEVLNQTSKDVRLHTMFENIDSIAKLNTLFQNGGIGRLDANLVLTNDLTISNDVYLLGNHYNINMAENKFIISENKTFKCEQTSFNDGENTIQQKVGSKVELTECSFTNCTGLGSVIDCQIDRTSLTNPTDFTTNLEKCVFDSCDMMILHGGELSVTNCVVNGTNTKVDNPNYPFFLYQTDGTARILQSEFNFIHDTDIDEDIEFNSCIFVCGETAEINGYDHTELQKNNLTQFLEIQRNTSKIDVTYYYPAIEDYITLQSNNGFCHAVSNVDYVFKTNVTPERR